MSERYTMKKVTYEGAYYYDDDTRWLDEDEILKVLNEQNNRLNKLTAQRDAAVEGLKKVDVLVDNLGCHEEGETRLTIKAAIEAAGGHHEPG